MEQKGRTIRRIFMPTRKDMLQINTVMLMIHIGFCYFYLHEHMPALFVYNLVSIAVFASGYYRVPRYSMQSATMINIAEIFVFMTMNMIFLGWGYGYQYYCFGFLTTALLSDLFFHDTAKLSLVTRVFIVFDVAWFIVFRIWSYSHEPVYRHGSAMAMHMLYCSNAVITMVLIISFTMMNIQMIMKLDRELSYSATHDPLTGLRNRRWMKEYLKRFDTGKDEGSPVYLGILDLDHFKEINDTFGHSAGDAVLTDLAGILTCYENRYRGFQAARWGGEEFLLLYETESSAAGSDEQGSEAGARELFGTLREELHRAVTVYEQQDIPWTGTIGVCCGIGLFSSEEMLRAADVSLYKGKDAGRDTLIWYTPEDTGTEDSRHWKK